MGVGVNCECGRRLRAKDGYAGQPVQCPGCGKIFLLPNKAGLTVSSAQTSEVLCAVCGEGFRLGGSAPTKDAKGRFCHAACLESGRQPQASSSGSVVPPRPQPAKPVSQPTVKPAEPSPSSQRLSGASGGVPSRPPAATPSVSGSPPRTTTGPAPRPLPGASGVQPRTSAKQPAGGQPSSPQRTAPPAKTPGSPPPKPGASGNILDVPGLWDGVASGAEAAPPAAPLPASRPQPALNPLSSPLDAPGLWDSVSSAAGSGSPLDSSLGTTLPPMGRSSGSSNRFLYILMGLAGAVAALVLVFIAIRLAMGPSKPDVEVAQVPSAASSGAPPTSALPPSSPMSPSTLPATTSESSPPPAPSALPASPGNSGDAAPETPPVWQNPSQPPVSPGVTPPSPSYPTYPSYPGSGGESPAGFPQGASPWNASGSERSQGPPVAKLAAATIVVGLVMGVIAWLIGSLISAGLFQLSCLICRELNLTFGEACKIQLGIGFVLMVVHFLVVLGLTFGCGLSSSLGGLLASLCDLVVGASLALPVYTKRLETSFGKALLVFVLQVVFILIGYCIFSLVILAIVAVIVAAASGARHGCILLLPAVACGMLCVPRPAWRRKEAGRDGWVRDAHHRE